MAVEPWQLKPPALPPISRMRRMVAETFEPPDATEESNREASELVEVLRGFDYRSLVQEEV